MNIKNIAWFSLLTTMYTLVLFGMFGTNPGRVAISESSSDSLDEPLPNRTFNQCITAHAIMQAERDRIFRDPSSSRQEQQRAEQKLQAARHACHAAQQSANSDNASNCCTIS